MLHSNREFFDGSNHTPSPTDPDVYRARAAMGLVNHLRRVDHAECRGDDL